MPPTDPHEFDARALIGACEAVPMTRAEIARRAGVARSTVTRLANGERGARTAYRTIERLRAVLPTGNK